jgi:hypothetical protein
VDGVAYSLHRPTVCQRKRGGESFLIGVVLSCHVAVGGAIFPRDVKTPSMDILRGVYHPVTCKTESYMEKLTFTDDMII